MNYISTSFPINEETVLAKLDSTFEQALLNIISANPISHIDSIYNSLLENNYKIFYKPNLKKLQQMKLVVLIRLMNLKLLFKEVEILKDKKFLISLISQS